MSGGNGADQFVYYVSSETGLALGTYDFITGFSAAEGDKFNFGQMDSNLSVAGSQDWTFIGTADFTAAGQVRVVVVGGDTCLGLNANNDLAADSWIQVAGEHSVDASWFVL